jgi:AcrR family transcriptional regulator
VTRTESTRQRLIAVARELFASHGYQETSVQEVLDRSGASRGALYHHFQSKKALFEAVLEEVERELADAIIESSAGATTGAAALRAGSAAFLDAAKDPAIRQLLLIDAPNAVGWSRWRAIDARYGFGLLKAALQNEANEGRLPPDLVDAYAHILLAALLELGLQIANAPDATRAQQQAQRAIDALLARLLTGDDRYTPSVASSI